MVRFQKGHKNSKGESAEWVIVSHKDGHIISSHKTKADAEKHLGDIRKFKHMGESMDIIKAKRLLENAGYLVENDDRYFSFNINKEIAELKDKRDYLQKLGLTLSKIFSAANIPVEMYIYKDEDDTWGIKIIFTSKADIFTENDTLFVYKSTTSLWCHYNIDYTDNGCIIENVDNFLEELKDHYNEWLNVDD